jgi:hypothetical protein
MNFESKNLYSWSYILKNLTVVYIVLFFAAPSVLTRLLATSDVDCDFIEWQGEDDSSEEDCFDDLAQLFSHDLLSENAEGTQKRILNGIFMAHSDYDPDILIPPPRSI